MSTASIQHYTAVLNCFGFQVKQESLRQHIGVVPQDTVLFNADIKYNIRYGNIDSSDADVINAAEAADVNERIMDFPDGIS